MKLLIRRGLVLTATSASLVMGGVAVQGAAGWAHSNAPTSGALVTAGQLQDQLDSEQARSAALQAQVDALLAQTSDFNTALNAAGARVASDVQKAAVLRAQLATAQKQLAAIRAAAAKAARAAASHPKATPAPTHATTGASGGKGGGDD